MFLEIRERGKNKKYYLVHSFREAKKVVKLRRYLGQNLSRQELGIKRKRAEGYIKDQIKKYKEIRDPLKHVLSEQEIEQVRRLEGKGIPKVHHLNKREWLRFSEVFSYNTNAIEGSELTQRDVIKIVEEHQKPKKDADDIAEAEGVVEAVDYIRRTKDYITLRLLKRIHKIVFKNSKGYAGEFRKKGENVVVRDADGWIVHQGAPPEKVVPLLKELILWYQANKEKYPALLLAAVVHNQFENIHPFRDGNGRVGRLLLNNILLKHDLPPVNIEFRHRLEYYQTLRVYQMMGDIRPTLEFILKEYKHLRKELEG